MYKPYHLIGLELGISVANAALRGEATGAPDAWRGDVVATAKRDLRVGEVLDGEGGYTVWGRLMPAEDSLSGKQPGAENVTTSFSKVAKAAGSVRDKRNSLES